MNRFQDIFLTSSSAERPEGQQFLKMLCERLSLAGFSVISDLDRVKIETLEIKSEKAEFERDIFEQLHRDIISADTVISVMFAYAAKAGANSKADELALKYNKRILPLLYSEEMNRAEWIDQEVEKLRSLLSQHQPYVRQHTQLLCQALHWQQQNHATDHLLTGETLLSAQTWLSERFEIGQAPCLPTALQGEYIAESQKVADQQMTTVFLLYAQAEVPLQTEIQTRLQLEGMTVSGCQWTYDMTTGLSQAIEAGIEKTDNLLLMVSPQALLAEPCQMGLRLAERYRKRIIVAITAPTAMSEMPELLLNAPSVDFCWQSRIAVPHFVPNDFIPRDLSDLIPRDFIPRDLSDLIPRNFVQSHSVQFERAMAELLRSLHHQADYVKLHKQLLVKALAWERQGRDRKFLLRDDDFDIAQTWLTKPAVGVSAPTDLHEAYLKASEGSAPFYDVFISYGRADSKTFASELCQHLSALGLQVWFDQNNIPLGVDFQQQIDDGIEKSHNFVFIISPHAVNSVYCAREIELAVQLNKRILPVLQVEEIDYATWKARSLTRSLDDWKAYQDQGKHNSFANMHPSIGKINWVYARAEDDFETAVSGLVSSLKRDEVTIHQHTELLVRALSWESHQRQTRYLLSGKARQQAHDWLVAQFKPQSACQPVGIQAEFITESSKAASGGMTQTFIAYAQENSSVKQAVCDRLLLAGITVWTNTVDIKSGEDFENAIQQGIEAADNIIYLISAASIHSTYCQQEIEHALSLNKRIIPMLIEEIDLTALTDTLRKIQFINLTDNQVALDLEEDLARLLRTIGSDTPYYNQHKRLLVQAIKWQQQQRNPSLLLRRKALEEGIAWAQMAATRAQHSALPIQLSFLEASRKQPAEQTISVFISHHADDFDFSARLNNTLIVQGKSTWFTPQGAEEETDSLTETQRAIDNAENVLFVLSPVSVCSEACLTQLRYAQAQHKRIIPVIYQDVLRSMLPDGLSSLPLSDFRRYEGDFLVNFGELFRLLESDPAHVQSHTRLLVKAKEWEASDWDDSFLLRGKGLTASAQWLSQATDKPPRVSELQRIYIQASQALPFRKVKARTVAITTAVTALFVSAVRLFGGLQPLEMQAYDLLLRLRPDELTQDERMLIVKVDSESGKWLREQMEEGRYDPGIGTIPDKALSEAIEQLKRDDARLIGLDFFRDFLTQPELAQQISQTENIIGICQSASQQVAQINNKAIDPARVGFANLLLDGGKIVRRHYLNQWVDSQENGCTSYEAFSLQLARDYLASEGISYQDPYAETTTVPLKFDNQVTVPQLIGNGTAYSGMTAGWGWSSLGGYQTLLNYRVVDGALENFAPQVSFLALVQGKVAPELIRDRIVIIGYTDFSDRNSDDFNTPYKDAVPGVFLHGQMTSQLVNAVLEDRLLIRWWPFWQESLWILLWSGVGGITAWRLVRPTRLWTASLGSLSLLTLACYGLLIGPAISVPWLPAALGWGISAAGISWLTVRLRKGPWI